MARQTNPKPFHIEILEFVRDNEPVSSGDVAQEFGITSQRAHAILYGLLARHGLLDTEHYQDKHGKWKRRRNTAHVTKRGLEFLEEQGE